MPEEETIKRARKDKRQGKAPSTQAGEFVREEFHHIREGNTARARLNKPLRLVCPRRAAPESN